MTPAESLTRVLDVLGGFPDATVRTRAAVVRAESVGAEAAVSRLLLDPLTAFATRDAFAVVFSVDGRPHRRASRLSSWPGRLLTLTRRTREGRSSKPAQ